MRHRGGRARARVAEASAGGDASAPVIVGMGSAGVDYLASIAAFPEPDAKLRTDSFEVQGGGNCGNALTATARLGCRPRILTKLSDDGAGKAIVDEFEADGVDTSAIVIEKGASSPFTYIIVDRAGATRTCIHTPGPAFAEDEIDDDAIVALLTGASLAYFDGRLTEVAIKVATKAREMGIPVLVEGERLRDNLETLLRLGDHVCTSAGYPRDATGEETTETAMVAMLAELPRAKTLVTTLGSRGAVMVARVDDVFGRNDHDHDHARRARTARRWRRRRRRRRRRKTATPRRFLCLRFRRRPRRCTWRTRARTRRRSSGPCA